jgi:hypothetical protein
VFAQGWTEYVNKVDRFSVPASNTKLVVAGLRLASPIGLAAGFDKSARAVPLLVCLYRPLAGWWLALAAWGVASNEAVRTPEPAWMVLSGASLLTAAIMRASGASASSGSRTPGR